MKRYIVTILAAAAVLAGCARSEMPGESTDGKTPQGLKAWASLGEGVKSHFGPDGYKLVWDSTDKLYAFSIPLGKYEDFEALAAACADEVRNEAIDPEGDGLVMAGFRTIKQSVDGKTARSGVFNITPTGSGKSGATFVSPKPASWWFGLQENASDDDFYYFAAFYPAPAEDPEIKFFNYSEIQGQHPVISALPFPYFDVTVPAVQNGVDYQDYQLLYNQDDIMMAKSAILSTDDQLHFGNFRPMTSILEFTLATTDDVNVEIDHLEITLSTQESAGGEYASDRYALAGTVPFFFTWNGPNELRLWNRFRTPFMAGFGSDFLLCPFSPDSWEGAAGLSPTLKVDFSSPVPVSKNQKTKKYYAVMIPSRCVHMDGCDNPKLTFDAYNANDEKILTKTITTSSTQGIEEGMKYSLDLTLDTYYAPDVLSGLFTVAEGKQVYIASGNLQTHLTAGVVDDWQIAPHQYDFVGAASYDLPNYTGWFDLFGFSTESNNFGITTSTLDADYAGAARGWTDAYPVAQGRGWRTITADEGVGLFAMRPNATDLFSFATIYALDENNQEIKTRGLVFLPDQWVKPENCNFHSAADYNFSWSFPFDGRYFDFSHGWNNYYANDPSGGLAVLGGDGRWEDMQAAGAVYWPMAGRRDGTSVEENTGAYWSGSPDSDEADKACILLFDTEPQGFFWPVVRSRTIGACVRLIKEFN